MIKGFNTESDYLKTKRKEAIAYLGDKWLLAVPVARKTEKKDEDTSNSTTTSKAR